MLAPTTPTHRPDRKRRPSKLIVNAGSACFQPEPTLWRLARNRSGHTPAVGRDAPA